MAADSLAMMPWFPRDFLAATIGWRLLDRALYRCLLDAQWELGALPDDEEELARIAGATKAEFDAAWPRVRAKFQSSGERLLQNERLEEHRRKALRIRDDKRRAGKVGGQASGKSRSKPKADGQAEHQANGQQPRLSAARSASSTTPSKTKHPSPSPSPSIEENPPTPLGGGQGSLTRSDRRPRDVRTASRIAWTYIVEGASRPHTRNAIEGSDPTLAIAVTRLGGWSKFGQSTAIGTLKAPFRELYEQLLQTQAAVA